MSKETKRKVGNPEHIEDGWVESKSPQIVQQMFTDISPTYDFLNHALSLNIDRYWRRILAQATISTETKKILDVCGGTGDLSFALAAEANRMHTQPLIICSDFTSAMTAIAGKKFKNRKLAGPAPLPMVADTMALPFADDVFDLVTVAFGIRNVVDPFAGLSEMARVTRPGGLIAVLEFSKTRNPIIDAAFSAYFSHILPGIGRLITGTRAYSYLSKSVAKFPEGSEFCQLLSSASGTEAEARRLSFGIATVYLSRKKANVPDS